MEGEHRAIADLINNAGSLTDVAMLLSRIRPDIQLFMYVKSLLMQKINKLEWDKKPVEEIEAEVVALLGMAREFDILLVDQELIATVFRNKGFVPQLGANTLALLHNILRRVEYSKEGKQTGMIKRSIISWLNRLMPKIKRERGGGREGPDDGPSEDGGPPLPGGEASSGESAMQDISYDRDDEMEISLPSFEMGGGHHPMSRSKKIPFSTLLNTHIEWWLASIVRLQQEQLFEIYIKETEWLLYIHFHSFCIGVSHYEKETLASIGTVANMLNQLPPIISETYKSIARKAVLYSKPIDVFEALYPQRKDLSNSEQDNLHPWQRHVNRIIITDLMDKMNEDTGKEEVHLRFLQKFAETPRSLTILDLITRQDGNVWSYFLFWYIQQDLARSRLDPGMLTRAYEQHLWTQLTTYFVMGSSIFKQSLILIHEGSATIELVERCLNDIGKENFEACWNSIGESNAMKIIVDVYNEIQVARKEQEQYKQITNHFLSGSYQQLQIQEVDKKWNFLSVNELRNFFLSSNRKAGRYEFAPLEKIFVDSLQWLHSLLESSLFNLLWSEEKQRGTQNLNLLIPTSASWLKLYVDLKNKNIKFDRMRIIAEHLAKSSERDHIAKTATGFNQANLKWNIVAPDEAWTADICQTSNEWLHLFAIYNTLPSIIRILDTLQVFIQPSGIPTLEEAQYAAFQLKQLFESEKFDEQYLSTMERYTIHSKKIDPCLIKLHPVLFETIVESMELLNWLRESPEDANFQSSIEEAMGRSEMECPFELWEEQEGKPGRVDEQKLSMLNTVRRYLHDLIFRPDTRLNNLAELLDILRELGPTDENIISSLKIANEYRLPLMELLDDNSENSAPDRLLQLLQPARKAQWSCFSQFDRSHETSASVGQVWLKWVVPRKGKEIEKKQNLNELMDFQSSVVLARTDQRSVETQEAIDQFIQNFGWIKQLNENLSYLHQSGHFDFQTFQSTFAINESPSVIRAEVMRTLAILEAWTANVQKARSEYYFLNFFSMKHVWRLVKSISKLDVMEPIADLEVTGDVFTTMQDMLRLVNPDIAASIGSVTEFIEKFTSVWDLTVKERTATDTLASVGKGLCEALVDIPVRYRTVNVERVAAYPAGANIDTGIHVVCADNSQAVYDHILSAYARAGYIPEREFIYVCRPSTVWDDLSTLILRWATSHLNGRENKIYCLGGIETLPFDLQRKAVLAIREYIGKVVNPLLIISGQAENQHLVAQFAYCRTTVIPLPEDVLREYSEQLATDKIYSQGITVHSSKHAGAGKTFNIRTLAEQDQAVYVPIPLMHSFEVLNRLKNIYLERQLNESEIILLHFDIYDTVKEDLNAILFELVFLGGLDDSSTGSQFFWNPETVSIAFEIPAGSVIEKLRVCYLLPQKVAEINENTFITSQKKLAIGMGEDFSSPRYDGTSLRKPNSDEEVKSSNAYVRLQYVCFGLDMMEKNEGRFPYVYEGGPSISVLDSIKASQKQDSISVKSEESLSAARCYQLLMTNVQLDAKRPSLWCLWNFINVFYWQLRDMHYPESPINCACIPDPKSRRKDDAQSKAKLKGEVVQFLIRTAKEFATRQIKQVTPNRIVAVHTSGVNRPDWNGLWQRMAFEHDGKPAFKKESHYYGKFFMYWRRSEKAWVIDDIIEPTGPVYSRSPGTDVNGQWSTSPEWTDNPRIKARKIKDPAGYNGEAVLVEGCIDDGGSVSAKENGIYLLQPPYDDIDNHSHYIMMKADYRRHLFWGPDSGWQISPTCTNEEGAYCMSVTASIEGRWRSMPPDRIEDRAEFLYITETDYEEYSKKPTMSYNQAATRVKNPNANKHIAIETTATNEEDEENKSEEQTMEELWDNTVKWNDSNHECLLFSNENHVVSFLSLDPEKMRKSMHPGLLAHLQENNINVGENLNKLSSRFHEVLSALTEVPKTEDEAKQLLDGKYCLTGDSLLKMLAIFARLRCGVPVVLMGECGCGKTMLITYLCAWMGIKLFVLDVHGGTTERDIIQIFDKAHAELEKGTRKVFVFLDEINTCAHMGLMCEVICHRSLYGKRISEAINVLAALNPYRRRPDRGNTPGLVYQLHTGTNVTPDPMSKLVYRVHPIPRTLRDFIFDFGSLTPDKEKLYIQSMVASKITEASPFAVGFITNLIQVSQQYVRKVEQDPSATSLRDVRRCLHLIQWFQEKVVNQASKKSKISPLACATVLSLAFVYYYRLGDSACRDEYWQELGETNKQIDWKAKQLADEGFEPLKPPGAFLSLLHKIQGSFCENVDVEEGIAMNQALMENLFVVIICILNRIPIFVVGKPGSSKTLTMQVIASNLQGKQSARPFWRKYPAIYTFPYQCSPMSDSHSIQHQFDMAVRYQQHAENTITVLLLDEVGLAEHSPDMPLKVLHGMLVEPPIAVVGLSNWVLDPAKMNRAICLQRTEPSESDIRLTGQRIISGPKEQEGVESKLTRWLEPLAQAYHEIYTGQKGRDFVGMRDYYNLVKLLRSKLLKSSEDIDPDLLTFSLCRNFGGKKELLVKVLECFLKHCFKEAQLLTPSPPPVVHLIKANLEDQAARHLMLLTKNSAALSLMLGCGLLSERTTKVLIGSEFVDDKNELHLITQINDVKLAMANGSTVVLLNHDNIYEALYDVLNQRYLFKKDQNGKIKKMLRLAIGSRSQLCQVQDGFKIVVIVEQDHAYRNLDLPLLNRFEKQVLCAEDVLGTNQLQAVKLLGDWVNKILEESGVHSLQEIFCGFHVGTIPSAVLTYSKFHDANIDDAALHELKLWLLRVARPIAVMHSSELNALKEIDYFKHHSSFASIMDNYVYPTKGLGAATLLLTHSPISHLDMILDEKDKNKSPLKYKYSVLQLAELTSERQLHKHLKEFYSAKEDEHTILMVQCDPIACRQSLINHARFICMRQRAQYEYSMEKSNQEYTYQKHLLFIVHLPPGVRQRDRQFTLDFNAPWTYIFVDDLRPMESEKFDVVTMLTQSPYDLVEKQLLQVRPILFSRYQHALSSCTVADINNPAAYFGKRLEVLRKLLGEVPEFVDVVDNCIMKVLEKHRDKVALSDAENSGKVQIHVRMVFSELVGGSLRQSLYLALQILVVQALAHVLRKLDVNFNLSTIWAKDDKSFNLWFGLLRSPTIIDLESIPLGSSVGGKDAIVHSEIVQNTGQFGPFAATFPFSYKLIQIFNEASTRERVEEISGADPDSTLNSLCTTVLGPELILAMNEFSGKEYNEYLHDFVATAAIALPGLSFEVTLIIYDIVIRLTRHDAIHSIGGIHNSVWKSENRLFRVCSTLANPLLDEYIRDRLITTLKSIPLPTASDSNAIDDQHQRLSIFDSCVLDTLITALWEDVSRSETFTSASSVSAWLQKLSSIRPDLEQMMRCLSYLFDGVSLWNNSNIADLRKSYTGLQIVHIFFQEIVYEMVNHQAPISEDFIRAFIAIAQNSRPEDEGYFIELVKVAFTEVGKDDDTYLSCVSSFARRYLQEIVFGEQEGFYNIGSRHKITDPFVQLINRIINNSYPDDLTFLTQLNDLPLRRVLLHCLLNAEMRLALPMDSIQFKSIEAIQLFLQNQCDVLTNQDWRTLLSAEDVSNVFININDYHIAETQKQPTCGWHKYLISLARTIISLRGYACALTDYSDNDKNSLQRIGSIGELLIEQVKPLLLSENPSYHSIVLVLKYVRNMGGIDCIKQLLSYSKEELPWLPFNRDMMTDNKVQIPDPFPWIKNKEQYETVCGAVRSCATQSNKNTTQLDKLGNTADKYLLIAAIFSQTVLERRSLFSSGIESLKEWILNYSKSKCKGEEALFTWLCDGCPNYSQLMDIETLPGACLLQIGIYLSIWAINQPDSWLYGILFAPLDQKQSFIPTVPDDSFIEIVKASGQVGWYICPNGHKYSVGQCTMPMERSKCTACGADIGGQDHVSVKGVRKMTDAELRGDPKQGYEIENNESDCVRLSTLTCRVLRLFLHNMMLISASLSPENSAAIHTLLPTKINDVTEELVKRIKFDWKTLKSMTSLGDGPLTIAIHMVVNMLFKETSLQGTTILPSTVLRNALEKKMCLQIERVLSDKFLREKIDEATADLEKSGETSAIRLAAGEKLWFEIHEQQLAQGQKPDLQSLLWRFREPVSYTHFKKTCELQQHLLDSKHKLLRTFLGAENLLHSLSGIADILSWHKILFEVIPHMSISRTDAIDITNRHIIERLPEHRRDKVRKVFARYAAVFNSILPAIELLYECKKNPFITAVHGRVDFGDGSQMDEDTSIAFSLPSMVTGADKGDFINGVCTIKILELLVDSQNEILESIKEIGKQKKGGFKSLGGPVAAVEPERKRPNVPAVNYLTSENVLRSQLIIYDRETHLEPLLRIFSIQNLNYGEGGLLDYDFEKIEYSIANGLLAGKMPINLCIRHFQYRGDIKRMGHLEGLTAKIKQEPLSISTKETIIAEIDTQERLMRLMQQIEVCIGFIVSVGSDHTQISGTTSLSTYVVSTLHIPQSEWEEISTPTIRQQISLRNLQSLYLFLEEKVYGNPLDDVLSQYSETLTADEEFALRSASTQLSLSDLLPIFRGFLIEQLNTAQHDASSNLKQYLEFASEQKNSTVYLEECEWWQHFPATLQLSVAKQAYLTLHECQN